MDFARWLVRRPPRSASLHCEATRRFECVAAHIAARNFMPNGTWFRVLSTALPTEANDLREILRYSVSESVGTALLQNTRSVQLLFEPAVEFRPSQNSYRCTHLLDDVRSNAQCD
jgi:hypothetical protein